MNEWGSKPATVCRTRNIASSQFLYFVAVGIKADQENEINCDETDISEIQLYSNSERIGRTLKAKAGRSVIVTGTVFHEHTAWHIRPLVMIVSQVL